MTVNMAIKPDYIPITNTPKIKEPLSVGPEVLRVWFYCDVLNLTFAVQGIWWSIVMY